MVAERLPAMCGSATLAMEVSMTSMKVASITEMAMSQGFTIQTYYSDAGDRRQGIREIQHDQNSVVHLALGSWSDVGDDRRALGYFLAPIDRPRHILDAHRISQFNCAA